MSEQNEQSNGDVEDTKIDAVYVGEAIFTAFAKKSVKGEDKIFVSFLLHTSDCFDGLATAELGTIFKLYVTRPPIGA